MEENTQVATVQDSGMAAFAIMKDGAMMERMLVTARMMAESKVTVPKHLQGNVGDCMAIIMQAAQWGMNPFAVAQKTHIVNGVLGYEAQLVNAVIQTSGAISGRFLYEYKGDGASMECRVGATIRGESQVTWGEWLKSSEVITKNSPLWKSNPKQQIGYLQVKNWSRAFCPGAILGVYTPDELADPEERVINPIPERGETVPPASLPPYPDDQFQNNLPAWRQSIASGKATAEKIIARSSTKYTWSDAQKAALCAPAEEKPPVDQGQQPNVIDAEFTATYDAASKGE